jgi:ABC-2 type transport system permease protein
MGCGTQKVPPVFIDRGIPVEYELVRSLCIVSEQKRKKLGVLKTDAELFGGFNMQAVSANPNWPIIDELEKQYEVVKVDPAKPITEKFDVLMAVQPSSLGPKEMANFCTAIASGQPTAIFEDPSPLSGVPATSEPRRAPNGGNPMFGGMPPPPKGDISKLWSLLGIDFPADQIVWQDYNPIPKANFTKEFVFVDKSCGAKAPFDSKDEISSGLQHVLFLFPGGIAKLNSAPETLKFTPLVETSEKTGYVSYRDLLKRSPFGQVTGLNPNRRAIPTARPYVMAAHIDGTIKIPDMQEEAEPNNGEAKDEKAKEKLHDANINVVVVADTDWFSQDFFSIREQGDVPELGIHFDFDNVTLMSNILDSLAGDRRFIEIRNRRPAHRTLTRIENRTKEAKQQATDARESFVKQYQEEEERQQKVIMDKIAELQKRKNVDVAQMATELGLMKQDLERQKEAKLEQLRKAKDKEVNTIETNLNRHIRSVQDQYKLWAVLLPPILPLLLAVVVFFTRRAREHEGVAKTRLR